MNFFLRKGSKHEAQQAPINERTKKSDSGKLLCISNRNENNSLLLNRQQRNENV